MNFNINIKYEHHGCGTRVPEEIEVRNEKETTSDFIFVNLLYMEEEKKVCKPHQKVLNL